MKLVLLTYINRSGSTFLARNLDDSAEILSCPEADILVDMFLVTPGKKFPTDKEYIRQLSKTFDNDSKLKYWKLEISIFDDLKTADTYLDAFIMILKAYRQEVKPLASIIVFKAERLIHLIEKILLQNQPEYDISVISLVRDCRDVFLSQKQTVVPETGLVMSKSPVFTSIQWKGYINKVLNLATKGLINKIKFEELVVNSDKVIKQIHEYLNLNQTDGEWKSDLFYRLPAGHRAIHKKINEKPIHGKVLTWKNKLTDKEVSLIEYTAGKQLVAMGYVLATCYSSFKNHYFIYLLDLSIYYLRKLRIKIFFQMKKIIFGKGKYNGNLVINNDYRYP